MTDFILIIAFLAFLLDAVYTIKKHRAIKGLWNAVLLAETRRIEREKQFPQSPPSRLSDETKAVLNESSSVCPIVPDDTFKTASPRPTSISEVFAEYDEAKTTPVKCQKCKQETTKAVLRVRQKSAALLCYDCLGADKEAEANDERVVESSYSECLNKDCSRIVKDSESFCCVICKSGKHTIQCNNRQNFLFNNLTTGEKTI